MVRSISLCDLLRAKPKYRWEVSIINLLRHVHGHYTTVGTEENWTVILVLWIIAHSAVQELVVNFANSVLFIKVSLNAMDIFRSIEYTDIVCHPLREC